VIFKDYYAILEISREATHEEIKNAFRIQALKWHPDRNPHQDTTRQMQDLNEAYLVLRDFEARKRYDIAYKNFKEVKQNYQDYSQSADISDNSEYSFDVSDDTLKRWIENARRQAVDLAQQTIKDFKGMAKVGIEAGAKEIGSQIVKSLVIGVIISLIAFTKNCH